jgi:hypothetical protein
MYKKSMEQSTPNPKCPRCKCYWKPDETDIKSSGLYFKCCKKCRDNQRKAKEKNKCPHNKRKSNCRECGGTSICIHDKFKSICRECGGTSICIHDKFKSICRECGGSQICIHDKEKSKCRECGGTSICIHNKRKSRCSECGGTSICIHNKRKSNCRECGGTSICIHNKRKSACKECNFQLYLINIQRRQLRRLFKLTKEQIKTKPSIEYLGCSIEDFINHIEGQFKDGMTWDNIHLDHIKPVSKFNLDDPDEFLDCCNYKNFQPLLAKDNLEKHNKFTSKDEEKWCEAMGKLKVEEK